MLIQCLARLFLRRRKLLALLLRRPKHKDPRPHVRERLRKVEDDEPRMVGDIVAMRLGLCVHHLGLWLGEKVAHVTIKAGVILTSTRNPQMREIIAATYRIHEVTA